MNLASRVQGATKYLQSDVLITGETRQLIADDDFCTRRLCTVKVNNISEPVELFQLANCAASDTDFMQFRDRYEEGLCYFETESFRKASSILGNILVDYPNDGPTMVLMSRAVNAMLANNAKGFDPVWELPGK